MRQLSTFLVAALCCASMWATEGALSGRFTINANGDQVVFSQGNLQYQASTQTWRFAENQYDYIGADNANISDTCTGWIDLFGWGTGDAPTKHSTNFGEYTTFTDWGVNPISNGGNEANQWRTLTIEETSYLFYEQRVKGQATVNGVHGMVIIPDDWTLPSGLSFTSWPKNWTTNVYSVSEWQQMQDAGAVFLPCAGTRYGSEVARFDEKVMCWSSSSDEEYGYEIEFDVNSSGIIAEDLFVGLAVRLVQAAPALPVQPAWVQPGDEWDADTKTLTVNSNPVERAYHYNTEIEHVIISEGVTSIGDEAFAYCYDLTSLIIGDGVISIGNDAFHYCNKVSSVVIPNSVTSIGEFAFCSCYALTSVVIPGSVEIIEESAFEECMGLVSLTIEEGVTVLETNAFGYCIALTSLELPNSVTSIGRGAFHQCYALTSVTIPGNVANIGESAFAYCEGLTSVTIGDGVVSIGESAFKNCIALTSLTIGNSVTSIGYNAFEKCTALASVSIGNSVTSIGNYAFYECAALTSVEIPNSVEIIGMSAFSYCTALTSVTIGTGITLIDNSAFYGCSLLTSVTCQAMTPPTIGFVLFTDCPELAHIYVPAESVEAYKTATNWSEYASIIEPIPGTEAIEDTRVDGKTGKTIVNGQLILERNGKQFNALGTEIK